MVSKRLTGVFLFATILLLPLEVFGACIGDLKSSYDIIDGVDTCSDYKEIEGVAFGWYNAYGLGCKQTGFYEDGGCLGDADNNVWACMMQAAYEPDLAGQNQVSDCGDYEVATLGTNNIAESVWDALIEGTACGKFKHCGFQQENVFWDDDLGACVTCTGTIKSQWSFGKLSAVKTWTENEVCDTYDTSAPHRIIDVDVKNPPAPVYETLPASKQTCEAACGAPDECDEVMADNYSGAYYCDSSCLHSLCSESESICEEILANEGDDVITCVYETGWIWNVSTPKSGATKIHNFTDGDGLIHICESEDEYFCTVDIPCQQKADTTCIYDSTKGWHWENGVEGKTFTDEAGSDIACSGGQYTCDESNACEEIDSLYCVFDTTVIGEDCYTQPDCDLLIPPDCTPICVDVLKEWSWVSQPDEFGFVDNEGDAYVCLDGTEKSGTAVCELGVGTFHWLETNDWGNFWVKTSAATDKIAFNYENSYGKYDSYCTNGVRKTTDTHEEDCESISTKYHISGDKLTTDAETHKYYVDGTNGVFVDGGVSSSNVYMNADLMCSGVTPKVCESDSTQICNQLVDQDSNTRRCINSGEIWKWEIVESANLETQVDSFFDTITNVEYKCFLGDDYSCSSSDDQSCHSVNLNSEDYYCFSGSNRGYWMDNDVLTSSDNVEIDGDDEDDPVICSANQMFICDGETVCDFVSAGDDDYVCVFDSNRDSLWASALSNNGARYYSTLLDRFGLISDFEIICSEDSSESMASGLLCPTTGVTRIDEESVTYGDTFSFDNLYVIDSDEVSTAYANLDTTVYSCMQGELIEGENKWGWYSYVSPDTFRSQCPLAQFDNVLRDTYWTGQIPPVVFRYDYDSETSFVETVLVLEGKCVDEGPSVSGLDVDVDSGSVTISRAGEDDCVVSCSSGTTTCGEESEKATLSCDSDVCTFSAYGVNYQVDCLTSTITKPRDFIACDHSEDAGDPGVNLGSLDLGSLTVETEYVSDIAGDNVLSNGESVSVILRGEKYTYLCDSDTAPKIIQAPRWQFGDVQKYQSGVPFSLSLGDIGYTVTPGTEGVVYDIYYRLSYSLPLNIEEGAYNVFCQLLNDDVNGHLQPVGTMEPFVSDVSTLADILSPGGFVGGSSEFDDDVAHLSVSTSERDVYPRFEVECTFYGPKNELETGSDLGVTDSKIFSISDEATFCESNDDCFSGICTTVLNRCTSSEVVCSNEDTWVAVDGYYEDLSFPGICEACDGYWATDLSLDEPYYLQTDFDRIVKYTSANRNEIAVVDCWLDTDVIQVNNIICESRGKFVSTTSNQFTFLDYSWNVNPIGWNGETEVEYVITFGVQGDLVCDTDVGELCENGRMIVDVEQDPYPGGYRPVSGEDNKTTFRIYSSIPGYCVGNQPEEEIVCGSGSPSGRPTGSTAGGTETLQTVLSVTEAEGEDVSSFGVTYLDVSGVEQTETYLCVYGETDWRCSLDGEPIDHYGVFRNPWIYSYFDFEIPHRGISRDVRITCRSDDARDCDFEVVQIFSGETIDKTDTLVVVKEPVGTYWSCASSTEGSAVWAPVVILDLKSGSPPTEIIGVQPPYEIVIFTADFEEPPSSEWPENVLGENAYDITALDCSFEGITSLDFQGSASVDTWSFEGSVSRSSIVEYCSVNEDPFNCILSVMCNGDITLTKGDDDITVVLDNLASFGIIYYDRGVHCSSSDDCLGECDTSIVEGNNVYSIKPSTFTCVYVDESSTLRETCRVGDALSDFIYYDEEWKFQTLAPVNRFLCDGLEEDVDFCSDSCEYTCAWPLVRSVANMGGDEVNMSQGYDWEVYAGCDVNEDDANCRDCCEAPSSVYLDSECTKEEYQMRIANENSPDFCGIPSKTSYPDNYSCTSPCGSSEGCVEYVAGGTECTEWCELRSEYENRVDGYVDQDGNRIVYLPSCGAYDFCISLPFDPHCGITGCEVTLSTDSNELIKGNEAVYAAKDFKFYGDCFGTECTGDIEYNNELGTWEVCTSEGEPLRIISSTNYGDGIFIEYSLDLNSPNGGWYNFAPSEGYFQDIFVVSDSGECALGYFCMADADCENFPNGVGDETNDDPKCTNFRCSDPDAAGIYFGTIIEENYLNIDPSDSNNDPTWAGCVLGDCTHSLSSCRAYFLGIEVTDETIAGITNIYNVTLKLGTLEEEYELSPPINSPGSYMLKSDGAMIMLPGSILKESSAIFIELENSEEDTLMSLANLYLDTVSFCSSIELESGLNIHTWDDKVACYGNADCVDYTHPSPSGNGGYGSVALCDRPTLTQNIYFNNYNEPAYKLIKVCENTCGDFFCDFDNKERPENCRDCCSDYGTGLVNSVYDTTCYSQCEASSLCGGREMGEVIDDTFCGFTVETGKCGVITSFTEIEEVLAGPDKTILNISCYGTEPDIYCNIWTNETSDFSLTFDLEERMWDTLTSIPEQFSFLKGVEVTDAGGRVLGSFNALTDDGIYEIEMAMDSSELPYTETLSIQQKNRLPTEVHFTIKMMFDSDMEIFDVDGCYYRTGVGSTCSAPPIEPTIFFSANSFSGPNSIDASCKLDELPMTVVLSEGTSEKYSATGTTYIGLTIFNTLGVGRHTFSCSASAPYFYEAIDFVGLSVFGKISDADVSVPSELVPGSSYALSVLKISDELGLAVPFYIYSWELEQDDMSVTFGQTDSIEVPHNFYEGPANLTLKISQDYYDSFEKKFPVQIRIPQQIAVSVSPGIIYSPLSGYQSMRVKLILSNSGPTINSSIEYSAPKTLTVDVPVEDITVEGFGTVEVPVTILVPATLMDTDYIVTFTAFVSDKVQDQSSLRIVQTDQPIYEYNLEPADAELDLIYDEVKRNFTLQNVGNRKDSYIINSELEASEYEFVLDAKDYVDMEVTAKRAGDYTLCVRSVRLLTREPRCATIHVAKKEVTPSIQGWDTELTIDPSIGGSFRLNFTPGEYSGTYVIEFDSNLSINAKERSGQEGVSEMIAISFKVTRSGTYLVTATAYPKKYSDKTDTTSFWVDVTLPTPYEVEALFKLIDESGLTSEVKDSIELARRLVEEGDYEGARSILEDIANEIEKLQRIESFKNAAKYAKPARSYTFAIAGIILIAVGAVLYLK